MTIQAACAGAYEESVVVASLRLEGAGVVASAASAMAGHETSLMVVLRSGASSVEVTNVAADEECEDALLLASDVRLRLSAGRCLTVSVFARKGDESFLVADACIGAELLVCASTCTRIDLAWNSIRGVWVGNVDQMNSKSLGSDALGPRGNTEPPLSRGGTRPALVVWQRTEVNAVRGGCDFTDVKSSQVLYPAPQLEDLLSPAATLAQLAVPGFDPRGWLKNAVMPFGIGEHTVLEVLNLFLDGVAEQLCLTSPQDHSGDVQTHSSAAVTEDANSIRASARGAEVGPSFQQLEREVMSLRQALAEQEDTAERRARRCEDLRRQVEIAERSALELQADLAFCKRRLAHTDAEADVFRQASQTGSSRSCASSIGSPEILYCMRFAIRRVLLSGWESDAEQVTVTCSTKAQDLAEGLRRHLLWLWRCLKTLWDAGPLLEDVLQDVRRTPHAVASLASSGQPPWPEASTVPRSREAEQLLRALEAKAALPRTQSTSPVLATAARAASARGCGDFNAVKHAQVDAQSGEGLDLSDISFGSYDCGGSGSSKIQSSQLLQLDVLPQDANGYTHTTPQYQSQSAWGAGVAPQSGREQRLVAAEHFACSQRKIEPVTASSITYPCGITLHLPEYVTLFAPVAVGNASHRERLLRIMRTEGFLIKVFEAYTGCDTDRKGFLSWKNYRVHDFIVNAFRVFQLSPPSEGQTYRLFAKFDTSRNMILSARECLCLADAAFRATFIRPARRPIAPAEQWVLSIEATPRAFASTLRYPNGTVVDLAGMTASGAWPGLNPLSAADALVEALESGNFLRSAFQLYRAADRGLHGFLSWADGGVRRFVDSVFQQHGVQPPNEDYTFYVLDLLTAADMISRSSATGGCDDVEDEMAAEAECDRCLDARECLCLVDALIRATLMVSGVQPTSDEVSNGLQKQVLPCHGSTQPSDSFSGSQKTSTCGLSASLTSQEKPTLAPLDAEAEANAVAAEDKSGDDDLLAALLPGGSSKPCPLQTTASDHTAETARSRSGDERSEGLDGRASAPAGGGSCLSCCSCYPPVDVRRDIVDSLSEQAPCRSPVSLRRDHDSMSGGEAGRLRQLLATRDAKIHDLEWRLFKRKSINTQNNSVSSSAPSSPVLNAVRRPPILQTAKSMDAPSMKKWTSVGSTSSVQCLSARVAEVSTLRSNSPLSRPLCHQPLSEPISTDLSQLQQQLKQRQQQQQEETQLRHPPPPPQQQRQTPERTQKEPQPQPQKGPKAQPLQPSPFPSQQQQQNLHWHLQQQRHMQPRQQPPPFLQQPLPSILRQASSDLMRCSSASPHVVRGSTLLQACSMGASFRGSAMGTQAIALLHPKVCSRTGTPTSSCYGGGTSPSRTIAAVPVQQFVSPAFAWGSGGRSLSPPALAQQPPSFRTR